MEQQNADAALPEKEGANSFLKTEKLGKLMLKYSVPCVISLLVAALYNIVDQIFIGNTNYLIVDGVNTGNTANTVVFPLTVIALAIAVMIGDGCCAFVSICLGAHKEDDAHKSIGSAIIMSVLSSLVLTAVYFILFNKLLWLFGARTESVLKNAQEYFLYIALGIPFYMFGQAINPIIRSDGNPRFAMIATVAGAVVNLIFDPIFLYVCKWGMMGAAVATVMGQILTAGLSVWYLFHMKTMKLHKDSFRFHGRLMKKYLPLGVCSFLAQISLVVSMFAINDRTTTYSALDPTFMGSDVLVTIPLTVLGIVMKYYQIFISISIGIAAGCIPIVGYNIGAGRTDRAKKLLYLMLISQIAVGVVATIIVECMPTLLLGLFDVKHEYDELYYTYGNRAFRIYLCMTTLGCFNKGTFIYLQAMGRAVLSTMLSMLREIVFSVLFSFALPVAFGLNGILMSMPVSDVCAFIVSVIVIVYVVKRLNRTNADASKPGSEATPAAAAE